MAIQAIKLQDAWDAISPKIDEIISELPWKDFRKEDIYASCAGGNSAIFIDDGVELGESFFIARIDEYESTRERVLFLWIAYSSQDSTAMRYSEVIADMARNAGCTAVEFATGHESVAKHGAENGFSDVIYRCRRRV